MSDPFIAQVTLFAGNFAPRGWAKCEGQLLQISQNTALFSLVGTIYGGNGETTFALPDLRGRVPIHAGSQGPGLSNYQVGQNGGSETRQLSAANLPSHSHNMRGNSGQPGESNPEDGFPANSAGTGQDLYADSSNVAMGATANTGSSSAFDIRQPYLGITFLIALTGIYPSRN